MTAIHARASALLEWEWRYCFSAILLPISWFALTGQLPAYWENSWALTARVVSLCFLGLGMVGSLEWRRPFHVWQISSLLGRGRALAASGEGEEEPRGGRGGGPGGVDGRAVGWHQLWTCA